VGAPFAKAAKGVLLNTVGCNFGWCFVGCWGECLEYSVTLELALVTKAPFVVVCFIPDPPVCVLSVGRMH